MLRVGDLEIYLLNDATCLLDGGGPFGLVPLTLWSRYIPPQQLNLVSSHYICLLVKTGNQIVLIDTGYGEHFPIKAMERLHMQRPQGDILVGFARLGIQPTAIDWVINTHLHADHAGGNMRQDSNNKWVPSFPNAQYVTQQREYEDAMHPNERTRATYDPNNYHPLVQSGQMRLIEGDTELLSGIHCVVTRGHTPAHMSILFESKGESALFACDMASYAVHFQKLGWMTAFDVEPLQTLESKRLWQEWAIRTQSPVLFPHDPLNAVARFSMEADGSVGLHPIPVPYV